MQVLDFGAPIVADHCFNAPAVDEARAESRTARTANSGNVDEALQIPETKTCGAIKQNTVDSVTESSANRSEIFQRGSASAEAAARANPEYSRIAAVHADIRPSEIAFYAENPSRGLPVVAKRAAGQSTITVQGAAWNNMENVVEIAPAPSALRARVEARPIEQRRRRASSTREGRRDEQRERAKRRRNTSFHYPRPDESAYQNLQRMYGTP